MTHGRRHWVLVLGALAVVTLAPAAAAGTGSMHPLDAVGINPSGALQHVAHRLLRPPPGTVLTLVKVHDHPRVHDGVDFQKYEASDRTGRVLGSFLRMRVHGTPGTQVDLALLVERGKVVGCEAIRPVVLDGTPMLDLPQLVKDLGAIDLARSGQALAHLVEGLANVDRAGSAPPVELSGAQVAALTAWVQSTRPGLAPGDRIPDFSARDEKGMPVTPETLAGKPAIVVIASVKTDDSRAALQRVDAVAKGLSVPVVWVLVDGESLIARFTRRFGALTGPLVADPKLAVHDAFRTGFTPAIHVFDASGQLKTRIVPPFADLGRIDREIAAALGR